MDSAQQLSEVPSGLGINFTIIPSDFEINSRNSMAPPVMESYDFLLTQILNFFFFLAYNNQ